jgi:hypothetical protein
VRFDKLRFAACFAALFAVMTLVSSASADPIAWTDWTTGNANGGTTASGTMNGVTVTYTGNYDFLQKGSGTNYWIEEPNPGISRPSGYELDPPYTKSAVVDNAPTPSEMIALNQEADHVITFGESILNPVLAFVSLGSAGDNGKQVTYSFDQSFSLLSTGDGYWTQPGRANEGNYSVNTVIENDETKYNLAGYNLHGVIQFNGEFETITWSSDPGENWHGITVGTVVPTPGALAGLASMTMIGLVGLGLRRWRRR